MPLICEPSGILSASSTSSTLPSTSVARANRVTLQTAWATPPARKALRPPRSNPSALPTNRTASAVGATSTGALNDTPDGTAPNSPRLLPIRQNSGSSTPRVRPTTLDIPGLTKSKVSPDGRIAKRDVGAKLVIVMVGLPARGKSYITKKLARYLNWLQHDTRIFNVGERRRVAAGKPQYSGKTKSHAHRASFLPTEHRPSLASLNGIVDAKTHLGSSGLAAQIQANSDQHQNHDNDSQSRRLTMPTIQLPPATEEDEPEAVDDGTDGVELTKVSTPEMPDSDSMDQSANFFDPQNKRAALIREQCAMDTLDELLDYILEGNGSVGILDATNSTLERRKVIMKRIRERAGTELNVLFLESRCVDENLLESNMRLKLSGPDYKDQDPVAALEDFKKREYEEKNNMPYIQMIDVGRKVISHQIRGFLSAQANYYLLNFNLAPRMIWITRHGKIGGDSDLSKEGLQYAKTLTKFIEHARREWDMKQLHKLTHSHFPPQPAQHSDGPLHYRYPGPGGEGYLDIINRLRPVIVELERMEDHCLLVGHRSVARVLLAYFRGLKREEVADLDVPIGMLYCLEPKPYGVDFKAYKWDKNTEWFYEQPNFQLKRAEDDMQ
ncbi:unnamed protein product [Aureobasidium pullulans]|nr:unnamed protein product [Aureobasidium pullulans]